MTDFQSLARDAAEIAMSPVPDVLAAMADTLAAYITEEPMTPHQMAELESLCEAMRLLRERVVVEMGG